MWLEILVAYIKKVHRALLIAAALALFMFGCFQLLSPFILGVVYLIHCIIVIDGVYRALNIDDPRLRGMMVYFMSFIFVRFLPDAILLLSAIPYISYLITITLFFEIFEASVLVKYSLFHLLLSPSARTNLIQELIPLTYEELAMNPEELEALRSRQTTAISNLPEALKQLHANQKDNPEPGNHYTNYLATLQENQQKALKQYLEIKSDISKAKCMLSLHEVDDPTSNLHDFVILEKHYYQDNNYYAVPGATDVFLTTTHEPNTEQQIGLQPLFDSKTHQNNLRHPANRDSFRFPSAYSKSVQEPFYPCRYIHHPYEIIDGHPLALVLCESIEAFNASLQPSVLLARDRLFTPQSSDRLTLEDPQTLAEQQPSYS